MTSVARMAPFRPETPNSDIFPVNCPEKPTSMGLESPQEATMKSVPKRISLQRCATMLIITPESSGR